MFRVAACLNEPQTYKLQTSSGPLQLQTSVSQLCVCVCVLLLCIYCCEPTVRQDWRLDLKWMNREEWKNVSHHLRMMEFDFSIKRVQFILGELLY